MAKKDNVHLKLSEELVDIDAELELAMESLSDTNQRIDTFLNEGEEDGQIEIKEAAEITDADEAVTDESSSGDSENDETLQSQE
jgi:hypothetical protein